MRLQRGPRAPTSAPTPWLPLPALEKHFTKYQWLRSVLEGDADWDAVSTVAALAMGFRVGPPVEGADVKSSTSESILSGGVKDPVLAEAFGALPPRLDAGAGALLGKLEEALPEEDTEEREALLDMVRTIVGEATMHRRGRGRPRVPEVHRGAVAHQRRLPQPRGPAGGGGGG